MLSKDLEISLINYQKSKDEKYLAQIKNLTGNALNETQLIQLASREKLEFIKELRNLFDKKKMSLLTILG